jgi:hypothetical protein
MLPEELNKMVTKLSELASQNLIKDGSLIPCVFMCLPDESIQVIALTYTSSEEKYQMLDQVSTYLKFVGAKAALFISEVWYAHQEILSEIQIAPSKREDRQEAIIVLGFMDYYRSGCMVPFIREQNKIVIMKEETNSMEQFWETGIFLDVFEKPLSTSNIA